MANLQVKNVPEQLHRELQRLAKLRSTTMSELVLEAIRREVEQARFVAQLRRRRPAELGRRASDLLREARAERDRGLAR